MHKLKCIERFVTNKCVQIITYFYFIYLIYNLKKYILIFKNNLKKNSLFISFENFFNLKNKFKSNFKRVNKINIYKYYV